jgi:hypothetical protein
MLAAALVLLWDYSSPSSSLLRWSSGLGLLVVVLVAWLSLFRWPRATRENIRRIRLWLAPLALVALFGLIHFEVPLRVRWVASQSAFNEIAQGDLGSCNHRPAPPPPDELPAAADTPADLHIVGWYRVRCEARAGGAVMFSTGVDWFGDAGFAYLPAGGDLDSTACLTLKHFTGPWYTYSRAGFSCS